MKLNSTEKTQAFFFFVYASLMLSLHFFGSDGYHKAIGLSVFVMEVLSVDGVSRVSLKTVELLLVSGLLSAVFSCLSICAEKITSSAFLGVGGGGPRVERFRSLKRGVVSLFIALFFTYVIALKFILKFDADDAIEAVIIVCMTYWCIKSVFSSIAIIYFSVTCKKELKG